jgi:hypothetical protein
MEDKVNDLVNGYIEYLKGISEKDRYSYFYGTYTTKNTHLYKYLSSKKLSYTEFKTIKSSLDELEDYVEMHIDKPKKKIVKKKVVDSDEE